MSRVVAPMVFLLLTAIFAGCVEETDPQPFASLGAPQWEGGYNWTWAATQSGTWSYDSGDGKGTSSGSQTGRIAHSVINTATRAFDTPVYWVRADERLDMEGPGEGGMFGHGGLQAVAQSDLQPVAFASENGFSGPWDCGGGSVSLYRADSFPYLRFPLERGATWQGEMEEYVTMHAEVLGEEPVTVPAGTFDAVVVRLEAEIDPLLFDEEEVTAASFTTTVWYAEAVRNLVRYESHTDVQLVEEDEGEMRMQSEGLLELEAYSLVAGAEEGLPPFRHAEDPVDEYSDPVPPLLIAADTPLPLDASNGSLDVTFGVTEDLSGVVSKGGIVTVAEVATDLPWLEDLNKTLRWTFWSHEGVDTYTGAAVTPALPDGGAFEVMVSLVPLGEDDQDTVECVTLRPPQPAYSSHSTVPMPKHVPTPLGRLLADGRFTIEWHDTFEVEHTGTAEKRHVLAELMLYPGAHVSGDYTMRTTAVVGDMGRLLVVLANGDAYPLDGGGAMLSQEDAGPAEIVWDAEGRVADLTLGHTVEGRIDVVY